MLEENLNWLENTYSKIGNQIEMSPIGYEQIDTDKVRLLISFENKGLSDSLVEDYKVNVMSEGMTVLSDKNN